MNDRAERRADDQRHRLGDRVVDADRFDFERADIDAVALLEDGYRDFAAALFEVALGFQHARRKRGGVDRNVQSRPEIVEATIVILVGMGDDDAFEVAALFRQEADIGENQIHARKLRSRESNAAIHHYPLSVTGLSVAVEAKVHPDFADAAERQEHQFFFLRHVLMRPCFDYPKNTSPAAIVCIVFEPVSSINRPS
ncbi:hypothetical protein D9M72_528220 [compost metagenome]